ncbi:hypothetical protein [Brevibacterium sp. FAM 24630]|uniref:hypothetical protein n=1 Tax=Brevibacterium sp. FAM 24630 TaxID=3415680 RepID=UPI003C7D77C3
MNIDEVREIIEFAEMIEGKKFPTGAADAWLSIVEGIPVEEARVAVVTHFRQSTDHLMPAHITKLQESWEPTILDDVGFEGEADAFNFNRDPAKERKVREEKFRADADELGIDPERMLKNV